LKNVSMMKNIEVLWNICCISTTERPFSKNISTLNARCCASHYYMTTTAASVKLANDMVATISYSRACQHYTF
jgi:hypothetical protein